MEVPKLNQGFAFCSTVLCAMCFLDDVRGCVLFDICLAYVAMIGVCSLISWYGPVHQLLPLLLVAIGIDDAYVIVTAFDETSDISDTPERVGRALSRAGAAVSFFFFCSSWGL